MGLVVLNALRQMKGKLVRAQLFMISYAADIVLYYDVTMRSINRTEINSE